MSHSKPARPYAIALFYQPSLAAAAASGVKLPQSRLTLQIPYDAGVRAGVLLPLSHIHVDPNAPPPDAPPSPDPPLVHTNIPLPATMYPSTSAIHPKNFDIADAFVRIQDYDHLTMLIPDPAPGQSTAAVLYSAGAIQSGQSLNKFHGVKVRRTSELKSVLRRDGPMLVEVQQIEQLREATEVYELLRVKRDVGWTCWPSINVLQALATLADKMDSLQHTDLRRLRSQYRSKTRARIVKRRIKVIKDNDKKVRSKVVGNLVTPGVCAEMTRAIERVHSKTPTRMPSYLMKKIDMIAPKILSDLARPVVFVV